MAKVFSIHMLASKEGVKDEDVERFVVEEWYPNFVPPPGFTGYLLKGIKGDRQGRYLWIWEYESVEAAERAEAEGLWQKPPGNAALIDKWWTFDKGFQVIYTDYVVVE